MDCLLVKLTRGKLLAAAEAAGSSRTSGSGQILDKMSIAYWGSKLTHHEKKRLYRAHPTRGRVGRAMVRS